MRSFESSRGCAKEQVDEMGLAAPYATPNVEAAHGFTLSGAEPARKPGEHSTPPCRDQRPVHPLEILDQR